MTDDWPHGRTSHLATVASAMRETGRATDSSLPVLVAAAQLLGFTDFHVMEEGSEWTLTPNA